MILLQNRLEHTNEEKMKNLEDQLTLAKNENESLKKFVGEISEQHRLISLDMKVICLSFFPCISATRKN